MRTGLIVSIKEEYAILLSEGTYLKVSKKPSMALGQEIYFSSEDLYKTAQSHRFSMKSFAMVAILFILLLVGKTALPTAQSYQVLVEINPSVLFTLGDGEEVLQVEAYNEDGKALDLSSLKGLLFTEALEGLLVEAKEKGYLDTMDLTEDFIYITSISHGHDERLLLFLDQLAASSEEGFLGEATLILHTETQENLLTHDKEGTSLGLAHLRAHFGLGAHETPVDLFKDPIRRAQYLAKAFVLEEDPQHELLRYQKNIESKPLSSQAKEAFEAQLATYKESIDELHKARKAYQVARRSGDEVALIEALKQLEESEAYKKDMEELKDFLEASKDLEEGLKELENHLLSPKEPTEERKPETPEDPGKKENVGKPENPGNAKGRDALLSPNAPETPGTPENEKEPSPPLAPGNADKPEEPGKPENPGNGDKEEDPENPPQLEETSKPENPGDAKNPKEPGKPEDPGKSKDVEMPSTPRKP